MRALLEIVVKILAFVVWWIISRFAHSKRRVADDLAFEIRRDVQVWLGLFAVYMLRLFAVTVLATVGLSLWLP